MSRSPLPVYQRGWVINSQQFAGHALGNFSISKGMGDQFSAVSYVTVIDVQYIKGDG